MTRYLLLVGGLLALLLVMFGVAEAVSLPVLTDPASWLGSGGGSAAAVGVGLLVADVVLPVPASLVMIAHGALFGVPAGAALSVIGAVGAALAGYGLGRWGGRPLVRWVCSDRERRRADGLVRRWGLLAVAASRPVPLLAETVAVVAGTSSLGPGRTAVAAALGSLPGAVLYAVAGAAAVDVPSGATVFALVLAVAAGLWLLGRRMTPRCAPSPPAAPAAPQDRP